MLRWLAIVLIIQSSIPAFCFGQQKQLVALELVLAIDTSTSVDEQEFQLQKVGLAAAFRHPAVQRSIESLGGSGAAVAVIQWAGATNQSVAVDWQHITNIQSAERMALSISQMKRNFSGFTDIGNAIDFSVSNLQQNQFIGDRRDIDVSGDGVSDQNDPGPSRTRAVKENITVNGLIIYSQEYDLGVLARIGLYNHYSQRVIGGDGAFVMEADSFDDFADAIRRKLVREISGTNIAGVSSGYNVLSNMVWAR